MGLRIIHRAMLCLALLPVLPVVSHAARMERGVAITDPETLRALDGSRLNLTRMLGAGANSSAARLFALRSMSIVRAATDRDFNHYVADRKDASGALTLFDRDALNALGTRFDLAGVINRMDRAYVSPRTCGEIRLIYRPIANRDSASKDAPPSRLPMTFNLIVKARSESASAVSCAEIAKRWLALGENVPDAERARGLTLKGGALQWITSATIDRIEFNIQVARQTAGATDIDGRADYLMKVFRFDRKRQRFRESPLENQIDAARITADEKLAADFRQWLIQPANIAALDRGTVVLPDRFLATSAIIETPSRSNLESEARKLFSDDDVVTALANASARRPLQNMLSPAGFARRIDDITCSGCHRTRAIGGFHLPGAEQFSPVSDSTVVAAASPHFFGDQERRRDILTAFRDSRAPDFSRGFSARPQQSRSKELAGTTYVNGWGAVCSPAGANVTPDRSFASWTCVEGLSCQPAPGAKDSNLGFCFPKDK